MSTLARHLVDALGDFVVNLIADDAVRLARFTVDEELFVNHLLNKLVVLNVERDLFDWRHQCLLLKRVKFFIVELASRLVELVVVV